MGTAQKYDAFGIVVRFLGDRQYLVRLDDGAEITADFNGQSTVDEDTEVGLIALAGSWAMEEPTQRRIL